MINRIEDRNAALQQVTISPWDAAIYLNGQSNLSARNIGFRVYILSGNEILALDHNSRKEKQTIVKTHAKCIKKKRKQSCV